MAFEYHFLLKCDVKNLLCGSTASYAMLIPVISGNRGYVSNLIVPF